MPRFFILLAGYRFSEMLTSYSLRVHSSDYGDHLFTDLSTFEDQLDVKSEGHETFEEAEAEAKDAMNEEGMPFAIVFQGSKLYAVVTSSKTITFEAI